MVTPPGLKLIGLPIVRNIKKDVSLKKVIAKWRHSKIISGPSIRHRTKSLKTDSSLLVHSINSTHLSVRTHHIFSEIC